MKMIEATALLHACQERRHINSGIRACNPITTLSSTVALNENLNLDLLALNQYTWSSYEALNQRTPEVFR
jgi:hypothetical protein